MTANHVEHEIATFTGLPGAGGGGSKEKPRLRISGGKRQFTRSNSLSSSSLASTKVTVASASGPDGGAVGGQP